MRSKTSTPTIVLASVVGALGGGLVVPSTATASEPTTSSIGDPSWKPVDIHLFGSEIGTWGNFFAQFFNTTDALLPPPNHAFHPDLGVGPGTAHCGPYDTELADGMADLGLEDEDTYSVRGFTGPFGVYLVWNTVPDPGAEGASPDSTCEEGAPPVIPNELFPMEVSYQVTRDGVVVEAGSGAPVPPLDDSLSPPFDADGHSHFPYFFVDGQIFTHGSPFGEWAYEVTVTDSAGNGWTITAPFAVSQKQLPRP